MLQFLKENIKPLETFPSPSIYVMGLGGRGECHVVRGERTLRGLQTGEPWQRLGQEGGRGKGRRPEQGRLHLGLTVFGTLLILLFF